MLSWGTVARSLFRGPGLSGNARRTFRLHLTYAVLDAAAGGILLNAPFMALKEFQAANWHLPLRELYSGMGMIATLYLAGWMAPRRKIPFVFIPGVLAAVSSATMALATGSAFWFLTLYGVGAMFEIASRQAITTIVRANYSVEQRGYTTGVVRKWSSLAFVGSSVVSAFILQLTSDYSALAKAVPPTTFFDNLLLWFADHRTQYLSILAGLLSLASFLRFRQVRVDEDPERLRHDLRPEVAKSLREVIGVVVRDRRYRRYLPGCFLDGFCQMLYFPLLAAFFSKDLAFGYVGCSALMHAFPALVAFVTTGVLGHLCDRWNPWVSWACIRFVWGLDALLLAATPYAIPWFAAALFVLPVLGRTLKGSVQGVWWTMWWQIGITHFAPPGEDTSRYVGIMVFLNGMIRLLASATGMVLAGLAVAPTTLMFVGGVGVILSGFYSLWMAAVERRERQPETMTEFERQFVKAAS